MKYLMLMLMALVLAVSQACFAKHEAGAVELVDATSRALLGKKSPSPSPKPKPKRGKMKPKSPSPAGKGKMKPKSPSPAGKGKMKPKSPSPAGKGKRRPKSPSPAPKKPKRKPSPSPKPKKPKRKPSPSPKPKKPKRKPSPSPKPRAKKAKKPKAKKPKEKKPKEEKPKEEKPKEERVSPFDIPPGANRRTVHVNGAGIEQCWVHLGYFQARAAPGDQITTCMCCPSASGADTTAGTKCDGLSPEEERLCRYDNEGCNVNADGRRSIGGLDGPNPDLFIGCTHCSAMRICSKCTSDGPCWDVDAEYARIPSGDSYTDSNGAVYTNASEIRLCPPVPLKKNDEGVCVETP